VSRKPRSVVVNHARLWILRRRFESSRGYSLLLTASHIKAFILAEGDSGTREMEEQADDNNHIEPQGNASKRLRRHIAVIVLAILITVIFIILIIYQGLGTPTITPIITADRTETANEWVFTITSTNGYLILKTDIQIGTKNATGAFLITYLMLLDASGTQGFNYTSSSSGGNITIGDAFRFNKLIYAHGSVITLTNPAASGYYCQWVI
jgi:hypothetical protein